MFDFIHQIPALAGINEALGKIPVKPGCLI